MKVTVVGAGTMGHGIAYVSAAGGHDVALADASRSVLETAAVRIGEMFEKGISRGKVTAEERDAALGRIRYEASLGDAVGGSDLVIEAVPERLELKRDIFADVARLVSPETLLASNTSSLSISSIASGLPSPGRVLGLHFFNPVPVMKLVEIVRGADTTDETVDAARAFTASIGKTPIVVADSPGFASSRLGVVLGLEAMRMLEQGVASAEDIDRAMELGYNHPMGPLKLTDLVGLDVRLAIAEHLHRTLGGATYEPPEILRNMVAAEKLGKKSGEGFYKWTENSK
jgi:3-hydroxybutyryl-CoA dehydrogenase